LVYSLSNEFKAQNTHKQKHTYKLMPHYS